MNDSETWEDLGGSNEDETQEREIFMNICKYKKYACETCRYIRIYIYIYIYINKKHKIPSIIYDI